MTGSGVPGGDPRRCLGLPGWGTAAPGRGGGGAGGAGGPSWTGGRSLSGAPLRPSRGRGGDGERRFPDRVGSLGSRGTDGRCLSGSGQCPSSSRLPSKTFWKNYVAFSCALKSRPPARLPTSRCLLVAASYPQGLGGPLLLAQGTPFVQPGSQRLHFGGARVAFVGSSVGRSACLLSCNPDSGAGMALHLLRPSVKRGLGRPLPVRAASRCSRQTSP